jgi:3-oxoacyl-[acyl-carrier-protein] synthase-1
MKNVYITGSAILCSLGDDIDSIIDSVRNKVCKTTDMPIKVAGLDYKRPHYRIPGTFNDNLADLDKEFYRMLYDTVGRAISNTGLTEDELGDCALFFGSTSIDMPMAEWVYKNAGESGSKNISEETPGYGKIISQVAEKFNIYGPCYTFTTACTSSANCLLYAASLIQTGRIERAIIVGYDLYIDVGLLGFESLKLIEPFGYKPFDRNRVGVIMGEGCGAVVLEPERRAPGNFRFLGGSNACDTFNVTTHNANGDDIAAVIRESLENCKMSSADIDAIKTHATGSPVNDLTEYNGMKLVFGDSMPPFTGIKPYVGHTVGASGVIELIIITESVARGFFPATAGFKDVDEEINAYPITENMNINSGNFMLNFFGFGGNCTSFIITNKE